MEVLEATLAKLGVQKIDEINVERNGQRIALMQHGLVFQGSKEEAIAYFVNAMWLTVGERKGYYSRLAVDPDGLGGTHLLSFYYAPST